MSAEHLKLRDIPSVDRLLQEKSVQDLIQSFPRTWVVDEIRTALEELRENLTGDGKSDSLIPEVEQLVSRLRTRLGERLVPSLRTLINATGVILHTNLGRAPISPQLDSAARKLSSGYSNLEFDLERGRRGHRDLHLETRLKRLLGCDAATVSNNNAAALLLILNTLADGRKVLVSRGELIEIGGSFRLPTIMAKSGSILTEIGTTNKTRIADYREAIDDSTALMLRVHPSNYRIVGFTERPRLKELVDLSRETGVPLVEDVGSGLLFPDAHPSLENEATVQYGIENGVDLVCFSGDKLLGGPQAGLVLGRSRFIGQIRKNPLMRACRVDGGTYAALERTFLEYELGCFQESIPVRRLLSLSVESIRQRGQEICDALKDSGLTYELKDGFSLVGGGSAPEEKFPTSLLVIRSERTSVNSLETRLRKSDPPVVARIDDESLILDLRTVFPEQDTAISQALLDISADL